MQFLKGLWRGDVNLAFTFWIIYVIGNHLFEWFAIFLNTRGFFDRAIGGSQSIIWAFSSLTVLYYVISAICVWRSANKYEGRAIWAGLAKAATIIGILGVFAYLYPQF
jgi:hypothetical protein